MTTTLAATAITTSMVTVTTPAGATFSIFQPHLFFTIFSCT
jgi:hypothetical protein